MKRPYKCIMFALNTKKQYHTPKRFISWCFIRSAGGGMRLPGRSSQKKLSFKVVAREICRHEDRRSYSE